MKKISVKIIMSIVIISLVLGLTLSFIGIKNTSSIMKKSSDSILLLNSVNKSKEFDVSISNIESTMINFTNSIFNNPFSVFFIQGAVGNGAYIDNYLSIVDDFIKLYSKSIDSNINAYILVNPDLAIDNEIHGIIYDEINDKVLQAEELNEIIENFNEKNTEYEWFFEAKNERAGYWSKVHEDLLKNGEKVISYCYPFYDEDIFFGIVGMDIKYSVFMDIIDNINIYKGNKVSLIDNKFRIVYSNNYKSNSYIDTEVDQEYYNVIISDNSGVYNDKNNNTVNGFSTLKNGWKILINAPLDEVQKEMKDYKSRQILTIIIGIIIASIIAYYVGKSISKPIKILSKKISEFGNGNLNVNFDIKSNDETKIMSEELKEMSLKIKNIIKEIKNYSEKIKNSSKELAEIAEESIATTEELESQSEKIYANSKNSSATVEEISASVQEVAGTTQSIAEKMQELSNFSNETTESANMGVESIKEISSKIIGASSQSEETEESVGTLSKKMENIETIIQAIDSITEQTNLLALNAAIEAARAGEAGKGFAVVADEIRKLAEESGKATEKIAKMIWEVKEDTKTVNKNTKITVDTIKNVDENMKDVNDKFEKILQNVKKIQEGIKKVTSNAEEENASTEEIISSMGKIEKMTSEISVQIKNSSVGINQQEKTAENINKNSEELLILSETLLEKVKVFEI